MIQFIMYAIRSTVIKEHYTTLLSVKYIFLIVLYSVTLNISNNVKTIISILL